MAWISKPARELSDAEIASWQNMIRSNPVYQSPFFHPECVAATSDVLPAVEVGLNYEGQTLKGVFAFERAGVSAKPFARSLTDYEGVIVAAGARYDFRDMLRSLGLTQWDFGHLVDWDSCPGEYRWTSATSPYVDLSGGFEAYESHLQSKHPSIGKHFKRNSRLLEKNFGKVRFEISRSAELIDVLVGWKSDQYEGTGRVHPFREPWAVGLLQRFAEAKTDELAGQLLVLYAGEQPIAMEYCLATRDVVHTLVTAYDVAFSKWSPGSVLRLMGLRELAERGVRVYDFGKGTEDYKQKFKTGDNVVGEGAVELNALRAFTRTAFHRGRYRFLKSQYSQPAKKCARHLANRFPGLRPLLRMR